LQSSRIQYFVIWWISNNISGEHSASIYMFLRNIGVHLRNLMRDVISQKTRVLHTTGLFEMIFEVLTTCHTQYT